MAKGLTLTSMGKCRGAITGGVEMGVQGFDYKAQGGYHGPPSFVDIPTRSTDESFIRERRDLFPGEGWFLVRGLENMANSLGSAIHKYSPCIIALVWVGPEHEVHPLQQVTASYPSGDFLLDDTDFFISSPPSLTCSGVHELIL